MFFFFNDTATTEIYTLSLHDALPIFYHMQIMEGNLIDTIKANVEKIAHIQIADVPGRHEPGTDRKSTRLNSSHANISYAVFCLKKKKTIERTQTRTHDTPTTICHTSE